MSKKAKHHKPKGPKSPPQNPAKETPPLIAEETQSIVTEPQPQIKKPEDIQPTTSEVKNVTVEAKEETPAAASVETPVVSPVKPKRNRGNRKKKHADGSAQEETEDEPKEELEKVVVEPKVEIKPLVCESTTKKPDIEETKETVSKPDQTKKSGGKNKKGNKGDDKNVAEIKKSDEVKEVVPDKKCDVSTQVGKKTDKKEDIAEEKSGASDSKIVIESVAENVSENKPEKSKRGKNKKKDNRPEQEQSAQVEEIKVVPESVVPSEVPIVEEKKIDVKEDVPSSEIAEEKKKDIEAEPKKDVKHEQKGKKDKKNKDKDVPKKAEISHSGAELKEEKAKIAEVISDPAKTKVEEKKEPEISSTSVASTDVVEDVFPSLASSIEETLQKLIVCESDMMLAEELYAADKKIYIKDEAIKENVGAASLEQSIPPSVCEKKDVQSEKQTGAKGKDKNKKSKKPDKISGGSSTPPVTNIKDTIETKEERSDVKIEELIHSAMHLVDEKLPARLSPIPPTENIPKKVSPIKELLFQPVDVDKTYQRKLESPSNEKSKFVDTLASNIKPPSPGLQENFFCPIKETSEGINLCKLGIIPSEMRRTPSPSFVLTPSISTHQKESSPSPTLREQLFQPIISENVPVLPDDKKDQPTASCIFQKSASPVKITKEPSHSRLLQEILSLTDTKDESSEDYGILKISDFKETVFSPPKKEASPGRSLQEQLLQQTASDEKPDQLEKLINPIESSIIVNPISDDIINALLSDIPPLGIDSSEQVVKCDQIPDSLHGEQCNIKVDSKLSDIKECDVLKEDIKQSHTPTKEIETPKASECFKTVEKGKHQKHKKHQDKTKADPQMKADPEPLTITEITDESDIQVIIPNVVDQIVIQPEEIVKKDEHIDVAKDAVEKESDIKIESIVEPAEKLIVEAPKPAKRAKDKKHKGKGHQGPSESENPTVVDPVISDPITPEAIKIIDEILKVDEQKDSKIEDVKKVSDFHEIKLDTASNISQSPIEKAGESPQSSFGNLEIPEDKAQASQTGIQDTSKEGTKPRTKSPANQSKNLYGPSNTPAKSSKYDYKKEKNKEPQIASTDTACALIADDDIKDLPKEAKAIGGATKKDNKHKGKGGQEQKKDKAKSKTEAVSPAGTSVGTTEEDFDEEFVYKYSFRTVFIANACHICKVQLKDDRVVCRFCHLVSYCNEGHRDDDWAQHQTLCYAICTLSHVKASDHVYSDAKSLSGQDYRLLRMQAIVSCEKILKRKLCPWEQEVLLYPRICCEPSCREWKSKNLKDCENCGQVSYCSSNPSHLPADHGSWCHSYRLYHRLVSHQLHQGRIEPDLPTKIFPQGYPLPDDCAKLFDDLYGNMKDLDDCHYATLTQLSTAPLTALYAYQKTIGADLSAKRTNLCMHIIGAELQFEADTLSKWECFFLHLCPGLQELRVVFIGPELNSSKLPVDLLSRIRMCSACRQSNRIVRFDFHDGMLYHDYVESSKFSKPDLICAFNPGFHRATGYAGLDTWPDTISSALRLKVPLCVTAYTQYEMPRDLTRVKTVFPDVQIKVAPSKNPYSSLRPDRNFISDDEMPLIFKNYQLMIVSAN